MIKTLKLLKSASTRTTLPFFSASASMLQLIKSKTTNVLYVPLFLTILFLFENLFSPRKWTFLILTCFCLILLLFLTVRIVVQIYNNFNEKSLNFLYHGFLTVTSSLLIICLISKFMQFESFESLSDFNNQKSSLLFMALLVNTFYVYIFSLIRLKSLGVFLSIFHKLILLSTLLISTKTNPFYYFQSVFFESLSASLLILMCKRSQALKTDLGHCCKSQKQKMDFSNQNEWKAMVNQFPIGVVILSPDKKVMFSNNTVHEMFDLQFIEQGNTQSASPEKEEQLFLNLPKETKEIHETETYSMQNSNQQSGNKMISFEDLNQKIGKLEEVEKETENPSPFERSHSYASSNELTILSHKSKTERLPPTNLKHYHSYNASSHFRTLRSNSIARNENNTPKSRTSKSKNSNSIYSCSIKQEGYFKNSPPKQKLFIRGFGRRKFQTENVLKFRNKDEKEGVLKTKTRLVQIHKKECDLNEIILELSKRNRTTQKIELKENNEKQGVKTYCTQFKNFKKSDNIKNKYQLKIQTISYKHQESFLILIEDVTYMDSIAHLRENNEYKNKIMTTLSHEIRTPLNGAIPALEEVVNGLQEESLLKSALLFPLKSLYLLQNVLGDAVDFALINSNQLYLNYEEFNIIDFMQETIEIFSLQADLKNIDLSFTFSKEKKPPRKVIADGARMRQILVSLIGNSMKNTSNGSIEISIDVETEIYPVSPKKLGQSCGFSKGTKDKLPEFRKFFSMESDKEKQEKMFMRFRLRDSGFGIPPLKLVRIKQSLKEKNPLEVCNNLNREESCGLGLTISHCLALILGPRNNSGLQIESLEGEGTTIDFAIEFYIQKRHLEEFMIQKNRLSTIGETKEITRYSTKKKVDVNGTQTNCRMTKQLSNYSKTSKVSKSSKGVIFPSLPNAISFKIKKFARSFSAADLQTLTKNPSFDGFGRNRWASQNISPIPSIGRIKLSPRRDEFTIGSLTIGKESLQISQHNLNHQFKVMNFNSLFGPKVPQPKKSPNDRILSAVSGASLAFDDFIQKSDCDCEEALVVDDDAFNLKSLELILSKFQKRCVTAYNGEEAIQKIQEKYTRGMCGNFCRGFSIIFMDYHMPIKNGVETTRYLKAMMDNREIPVIPIIACTAFGAKDLVEEWERAGMTHFVTKPITTKKIEAILEKWT